MRKISKSRTEDDVISSTNGSIGNEAEEQPDAEVDADADAEADRESVADAPPEDDQPEPENGDDEDYEAEAATPKAKGGKKKGKGRAKKRKAAKEKEASGDEEDEEEYEVEKVVDSKRIKGKLHYLIRWKGYSADSDTWEPENTLSCPELISKFNDEKENSKNKDSGSKKKGALKRKASKKKEAKSPAKKPKNEWDSKSADKNAEYEVERILEVHHKKNGKREFLIHWKGWSTKFDSWEPENHLNCADLIEKFMDKVSTARNVDSRNLRVAPSTANRFTLQDPTPGRRLSKRRGQRQRVRYDDAE